MFGDATLVQMVARDKPLSEQDLLAISGVGQHKLDKYGDDFLNAIAEYCVANGERGGALDPELRDTWQLCQQGLDLMRRSVGGPDAGRDRGPAAWLIDAGQPVAPERLDREEEIRIDRGRAAGFRVGQTGRCCATPCRRWSPIMKYGYLGRAGGQRLPGPVVDQRFSVPVVSHRLSPAAIDRSMRLAIQQAFINARMRVSVSARRGERPDHSTLSTRIIRPGAAAGSRPRSSRYRRSLSASMNAMS